MSETSQSKKGMDSSSPYHLHPLDNPGAIITSCLLNGKNYDMWEKAMMNAFRAKNKIGFVNESFTKPTPDELEADNWEACNSMLISWIFNSIEKSIQPSVAYMETVKAVWDDLKERFSIGNVPRVHELKSEISSLRQQGMSIMAYYTKLKGMWNELGSYSKIPSCTCGVAQEFIKEREEEKVHQFLMGLDDSVFGTMRSQILSMDPLPLLSRAYATITREELHRSIARGQEERVEAVALATEVAAKGKIVEQIKQQYAEKFFPNCKKLGHEVSECFELIDYPPWFSQKGSRGRGKTGGRRGRD